MKQDHIKKQILNNVYYKRYFRRMRSKLKKNISNGSHVSRRIRKKYNLKHISHISTRRNYRKKILATIDIIIPEIFCFIEDPKGTSKFFNNLRNILDTNEPYNLSISHEKTTSIGLSASFIFDTMIKEYIGHWNKSGIKIHLSGKISLKSKEVNNFLLSYGILKELGIS